MNQLNKVGTTQNGNPLMEITPDFLHTLSDLMHTVNDLLVYYRTNEEQKRTTQALTKEKEEIITPAEFAKLVKAKPDTVRKWSKAWLKPALVDPNAHRKKLYKKKALELHGKGKPQPQPETRQRYTQR